METQFILFLQLKVKRIHTDLIFLQQLNSIQIITDQDRETDQGSSFCLIVLYFKESIFLKIITDRFYLLELSFNTN